MSVFFSSLPELDVKAIAAQPAEWITLARISPEVASATVFVSFAMPVKRLAKSKNEKANVPAAAAKELPVWGQLLIVSVVFSIYGYLLATFVDLTTGDMGRHLKNGELFIRDNLIPATNLYSYTHSDYPFISHHWGSGVLFYLVERALGFDGLSVISVAISLLTFWLFLNVAAKRSSFALAAVLAVCVLPLLITRREIRPELFSYLFSGLFLQVLWRHKDGILRFYWLFSLPFLMVLWVNTHIYFFLGLVLLAAFLAEYLIDHLFHKTADAGKQLKQVAVVTLLTLSATCLNPAGFKGAVYPFLILKEYEFPVIENFSVAAVLSAGYKFLPLTYFQIVFGLLCLSWLYILFRHPRSVAISDVLLSLCFPAMALAAIRNFALFGYFALPLIAMNLRQAAVVKNSISYSLPRTAILILLTAIGLVVINPQYFFGRGRGAAGIGLKPSNDAASEFFLAENLQGPVFNNFDVGAYLIYHLYPGQKVFVDNRPEAYPAAFFRDVYFPLLKDEDHWLKASDQYGFNAIIFNHRDRSSWSEQFIVRRVFDPLWAPVFFDNNIIILVKRYGPNRPTVLKFEVMKETVLMKSN